HRGRCCALPGRARPAPRLQPALRRGHRRWRRERAGTCARRWRHQRTGQCARRGRRQVIDAARSGHGGAVLHAPARSPRRALLPLAIGIGGVAVAAGVQLVFDPFRTHIPLCILNHLTGLECPGCGAIRAVHSLLAGDLLLALRSNALVISALPLVGTGMAVWAVRRARGLRTDLLPTNRVLLVLTGIAVLFAVLRNLPMFWFLAP